MLISSRLLRLLPLLLALALVTAMTAGADEPAPQPADEKVMQLETQLKQQQDRITELERLLRQQASMLERMQQQMAATAQAPSGQEVGRIAGEVDALADNTRALNEKVGQIEKKTAETEKNMEKSLASKVKGLGNFSFGGDLRLRYEPFRGGGDPDRNRGRFRARFDIKNKFNDEWSAGLRIASGDDTDPISTNQSFTDFYQRKAFNIDRAYIIYTPVWAKPFSLTGGKFAYTWNRTELTFDSDLNPEGLSPALSFKLEDSPLQNIKLVGFALPFRESGGGPDSYMIGGAIETAWKLGSRAHLDASASYTNWFRTDAIRAAQSGGTLSGSSNRNAASATAYASRFGLLDLIAKLSIDTGVKRWPLLLLFDYVTNTRACANVDIAGVACNPRDRQGYWAEVAIGQTKEQKDLKFSYTLIHIEQEAVLGAFNFSDLRAPTDVVNHRFSLAYQAYKNITLGYTLLVGRLLTDSDAPWLKRSQIDLIYKF